MIALASAALLLPLAGCPRYGVIDDGTSVSWGPANHGKLMNPKRLARRGEGFHIPMIWATRGLNWGTDEMLAVIAHMGRDVAGKHRHASVAVGDLSMRQGGPSAWHRSHQSGRDVDLLFFMTDLRGRPVAMQQMRHVGADGLTLPAVDEAGKPLPRYRFDVPRNWSLVRAAIDNPVARVQFIFVYDPLRQMLLDHARAIGEPPDIVARASHILGQPWGAAPHDDHFHMRIYCSLADRQAGCVDYGQLRWTKRDRKYIEGTRRGRTRELLARTEAYGRIPAMLSLSSLPFPGFVAR